MKAVTQNRPIRVMLIGAVAVVAAAMFGVEAASVRLFGSPAAPVRRAAAETAINAQPAAEGEFEETATRMPTLRARLVPPRAPRVSLTAQQSTPKKVTVHRR